MIKQSIKLRLTALYSVILGIILVICSALVYWSIHRELHRDLNKELRHDLGSFIHYFADELDEVRKGIHVNLNEEIDSYLVPAKAFVVIRNGQHEAIYESPEFQQNRVKLAGLGALEDMRLEEVQIHDVTFKREGQPYLAKLISIWTRDKEGKPYHIFYGIDATIVSKRLARFIENGTIALLILLLLSFGVGYWFVHRVLKPVDDITREARAIGILSLDKRVPVPPAEGELQRLSQTFNEMLDRLQQAVQELQKFTADVSHELKTPLANLRAQVELAISRTHSTDDYRQILSSILEDVIRITRIVESMLLLAQVEAREFTLDKQPVDLADILRELVETGGGMGEARHVEVTCEEPVPHAKVLGDAVLLKRACFNIVDNAIKYTQEGGSARIVLTLNNGSAVFQVRDSGRGIPDEHLPYIFKRFYRVDKARSRDQGGTGLGLAIAKTIIEVHGGSIRVESRPGQGSLFTVTLPTIQS